MLSRKSTDQLGLPNKDEKDSWETLLVSKNYPSKTIGMFLTAETSDSDLLSSFDRAALEVVQSPIKGI